MEGGGGHAPPRSARLRGPPPPFSRATSMSARFALEDQLAERSAVVRYARSPTRPTAAPWRIGGSLCRCSLQSAGQHSSPDGYLADSAASATPPPTATSAAPLPAPRPAPPPGADSAPSRPWTRSHPGGPAAKSRGLRSPVARRLARPWQATAPTHGTWPASQGA